MDFFAGNSTTKSSKCVGRFLGLEGLDHWEEQEWEKILNMDMRFSTVNAFFDEIGHHLLQILQFDKIFSNSISRAQLHYVSRVLT